jgi:hypothetical protein
VQTRERTDDLQMAELFGANVHEEVLAFRILTVEPLNRILHGRRELTVRAAELLEEHVAKLRVRYINSHMWQRSANGNGKGTPSDVRRLSAGHTLGARSHFCSRVAHRRFLDNGNDPGSTDGPR